MMIIKEIAKRGNRGKKLNQKVSSKKKQIKSRRVSASSSSSPSSSSPSSSALKGHAKSKVLPSNKRKSETKQSSASKEENINRKSTRRGFYVSGGDVKPKKEKNNKTDIKKKNSKTKLKETVKRVASKVSNKIAKTVRIKTDQKRKDKTKTRVKKEKTIMDNSETSCDSSVSFRINNNLKRSLSPPSVTSTKSTLTNLISSLNCVSSESSNNKKRKTNFNSKPEVRGKKDINWSNDKCKTIKKNTEMKKSNSVRSTKSTKTTKKKEIMPKNKDKTKKKCANVKPKKLKTNFKGVHSKKYKNQTQKSASKSRKLIEKEKSQSKEINKLKKSAANNKRCHRVASLNAAAKVRLMCENDQDKGNESDSTEDDDDDIQMKKKSFIKKEETHNFDGRKRNTKSVKEDLSKALVPLNKNQKQLALRKRKLIDDNVEIIDTRSCKRMASLNASAILAASYLPERIKRSKSVESTRSGSVEMIREMQISSTVSRYEITPSGTGINGLHTSEVILKAHETIETVKQMKMSSKIKDRLIGIALLETENEKVQKKKKNHKNKFRVSPSPDTDIPELGQFQATKVHVTKVTQINTSSERPKQDKERKSGHKIESILERDSSVVHKYQVQTKSTTSQSYCVQMQSASNLMSPATAAIIASPIQQSLSSPGVQLRITSAPTNVMAAPIYSQSPNTGQPAYYNYPGNASIVHIPHPNVSASSHMNPLSIVNLSDAYSPHYSSAFSVPHYAHPHAYNYYPGFYQPAGPLLQPLHDPCLIHKPIPFHPSTQQIPHVHNSQLSFTPIHGSSIVPVQTFQTDPTQFFQQNPNAIRPQQTVLLQTVPQSNTPMAPATRYTLIDPNVHYPQSAVLTDQFPRTDVQLMHDASTGTAPSPAPQPQPSLQSPQTPQRTALTDSSAEYSCKSVQCSPPNTEKVQSNGSTFQINKRSSKVNNTFNKPPTVVAVRPQMTKKVNSIEISARKRKSMLLKQFNNKKGDNSDSVVSQTSISVDPVQPQVSVSKKIKSALTPTNLNKINMINKPNLNKQTKTLSVHVSSSPETPSPTFLPRLLPSRKPVKKRFSHGWNWEGKHFEKLVYLSNEDQRCLRVCYPAIRHNEGDIINVRDCVLLRSGPRKTDLPFVAKIAALWETPDEGEMMMSLLWYYRPEHTDLERRPNQITGEIFASKHRDTNSVACIDDKCYVLTYSEFCRYQRQKLLKSQTSLASAIVPPLENPYPRANRMPPIKVFPELVFCCRKVYDFRQKRILKNPF